jgi:hypothetical protein
MKLGRQRQCAQIITLSGTASAPILRLASARDDIRAKRARSVVNANQLVVLQSLSHF